MSAAATIRPRDIPHLAIMARRIKAKRGGLPWREWLARYFSAYTTAPFAQHHLDLWEWAASIEAGTRPRPFIACWPRGGAKSTTVELAAAWLGSQPKPIRNYVLYVSETQAQADRHVQTIAGMLERVGISRAVNEYGASKGWRRTEVRASNGFNVTAMGLDSAMRGAKLDEFRPDLIVFDDIDGRHDSPATVAKKIETITTSILPTGSTDAATIVVQNMIHEHGIMAQLMNGTADFLHDRLPTDPIPAIRDLATERYTDDDGTVRYRIVAGEPTWAGQSIEVCEKQINEWGLGAFLREAQHDVAAADGGLWDKARDIDPFRVSTVPDLERIVVAVDPNAGGADEAGIVVAGIAHQIYDASLRSFRMVDKPHGYVLEDVTTSGGSKDWAEAAVAAYHKYRADALIAERNNGGDMVAITIGTVDGAPPVELVWASRGKLTRAEPVQKLYADGRVHHVGTMPELERELATWKHPMPSPNRLDACFVAGTKILTDRGYIPIEDVRVGDLAMTRDGWNPITNHAMTEENAEVITVEFSDGRKLTGTRNHPIYTHNRGFTPLDAVVWSDIIETDNNYIEGSKWKLKKTLLSSMASCLFGTQTEKRNPAEGTTSRTRGVEGSTELARCTEKYGSRFMETFRQGVIFTTAMAIPSTITSRIWSALRLRSTPHATQRSSVRSGALMLQESDHLPLSGTKVKKGGSGIASMVSERGKGASPSTSLYVRIAANLQRASSQMMGLPRAIAAASAIGRLLMLKTSTPGWPSAQSAEPSLSKTSTGTSQGHAGVYAVRSYESGTAPVYNLEVKNKPEYFANGVLVHNCTWALTELLIEEDGDYSDLDDYYNSQFGGR